MKKFRLAELKPLETISSRKLDDLKMENEHTRVWLSRMTVADGAKHNNEVTIELFNEEAFTWKIDGKYEAE